MPNSLNIFDISLLEISIPKRSYKNRHVSLMQVFWVLKLLALNSVTDDAVPPANFVKNSVAKLRAKSCSSGSTPLV